MFNFLRFLFSLLKGIYNTCAKHTQVNKQASVARILFAVFLVCFQHQSIKAMFNSIKAINKSNILERLTIIYAMFNFLGFLFSLLKGIYNTCPKHTQVNKQASVARILFAVFLVCFQHTKKSMEGSNWRSNKHTLLDAQIK